MNRLASYFLLIAGLGLLSLMGSCKKNDENAEEENTENTGQNGGGPDTTLVSDTSEKYWYAYIDGETFVADTALITYVYDNALGLHLFQCEDPSGRVMYIYLTSLEPGTYPIDFDNAVNYQSGNLLYTGGFNPQGSITITSNADNTVSGSFEAELFNFENAATISITGGMFGNLPYVN